MATNPAHGVRPDISRQISLEASGFDHTSVGSQPLQSVLRCLQHMWYIEAFEMFSKIGCDLYRPLSQLPDAWDPNSCKAETKRRVRGWEEPNNWTLIFYKLQT